MERPQADIARWPPRTNDVDLDERRRTIRQRGSGTARRWPPMTHAHAPSPATHLTSVRESLRR